MRNRPRRRLNAAGFMASLLILIGLIFLIDKVYRLIRPAPAENIVGIGEFAASNSANSSDGSNTDSTDANDSDSTSSDGISLDLTSADMASGPLVLVDSTHPYTGAQTFSDFSTNTNSNVLPRDTSLTMQTEVFQPLSSLFDAYATETGWPNLQIYSTTSAYADASSLYTTELADRSSGYSFDIGLITSTGEVVAYLTKQNDWMVENSWQYGFVLRYPEDKTAATGVSFTPSHFRYVGAVHAAIMHQNNYSLEEYLNALKSYTLESGGLSYDDGTSSYMIYYVPADASGTTHVEMPKDTVYTVSGNNTDGFIFTLTIGASTSPTTTQPATEAATDSYDYSYGYDSNSYGYDYSYDNGYGSSDYNNYSYDNYDYNYGYDNSYNYGYDSYGYGYDTYADPNAGYYGY